MFFPDVFQPPGVRLKLLPTSEIRAQKKALVRSREGHRGDDIRINKCEYNIWRLSDWDATYCHTGDEVMAYPAFGRVRVRVRVSSEI
jgi:hypothetical protein